MKFVNSNIEHHIPIHNLITDISIIDNWYSEEIFSGHIEGLTILHKVYAAKGKYPIQRHKDSAVFIIILKGQGLLNSDQGQRILEKESLVVLPNNAEKIELEIEEGKSLNFLEFIKVYSEEDKMDLEALQIPSDEYYAVRFRDCEPYTEKIKSPNTVSRTVLPKDIIPRVSLGTVEALGPDKVGEHSHPMLEQLFLGLEDNHVTVLADNASCDMGAFTLLHIPLGSRHGVNVAKGDKMNYMWMDFFLTKAGEVWLDTHKPILNQDLDEGTK